MEIARLRQDAAALLADGRAKMVIGFRARGERRVPAFITDPKQAADLVLDDACIANLASYLRKTELKRFRPIALVARPAVLRSLVLLAAESQVAEGEVLALAIGPDAYHGVVDLAGAAALLKEKYAGLAPEAEVVRALEELAAMSPDERAAYWSEQFSKCTRCYACRAACPACYCERCIVEKNTPQWISTAAARHGQYAWNVIRAFHQAGRCTACGACQEACPQGIPLMILNAHVAAAVEREFGARAGYDLEAKPVIGSWDAQDNEEFIR
jgi:ferredoxin